MTDAELKKEQLTEEKTGTPAGAQADTGQTAEEKAAVSETWAEETIADLDDFIESQGIYIRQ